VVAGIVVSSYISVSGMRSPKGRVDVLEMDAEGAGVAPEDEWAVRHSFVWVGVFVPCFPPNPANIHLAVWQHAQESTVMVCYIVNGKHGFDFSTPMVGDRGVLTGSMTGGMMFPPRAGNPKQVLLTKDLDRLWEWHREALGLVRGRVGWEFEDIDEPFEEHFLASVRRSAEAIAKIPLWPLRSVWWFASHRFRCNRRLTQEDIAAAEGAPV
jgi:hypothetical protein